MAFVMVFSLSTKTYAISNNMVHVNVSEISSEPYDSDWMYNRLEELGFTSNEILELYQREANQIGIDIHLPEKLAEVVGLDYVHSISNDSAEYYATSPENGDVKYDTCTINFDTIARACGWTGGGTGAAYIIAEVTKDAFLKALVKSAGLGWVSAISSVGGVIFSELARHHTGCTITTKSIYQYDEYEGFGKWYMVDITYELW